MAGVQAAGGITAAANSSGPTSLETDLAAKAINSWGSSFAVGTGSKANSSPSTSEESGGLGSIPQEYILAGGILAVAVALAVILK